MRCAICLGALVSINRQASAAILYATAAADASNPRGRIFELDYIAGTILNTFNGPTGFDIGDGFTGAAFRQATDELYITDGSGSNRIFRINPETGAVNGSFPSPTGSTSVDGLEFVGDTLYGLILANATVAVINADTGALINTLPSNSSGLAPGGITAAGGVLYSRGAANTTIVARNLSTGLTFNSFTTPNNEVVLGLASDGVDLYAASNTGVIYRINRANGQVLDSRAYGINFDSLAGIGVLIPEPAAASLVVVGIILGSWLRSRHAAGS